MFVPQDPRVLHGFIQYHFGVDLPDKCFTPGNSTPFAFVADAFFHPDADVAAWASRSGGKTLGASILAGLMYLRYGPGSGLHGRVLAGSEHQAQNLYGYWSKWCRGPLAGLLQGDPTQTLTRISDGQFEVLAASQKRVRGPKVQCLLLDEMDEIDPEVEEASHGMIASMPTIPARTIYGSTWHRVDGPMARLIAKTPGNRVRVHRWNIWESAANCPRDRHDQGRGCDKCDLAVPCLAKAREFWKDPERKIGILAQARGLYRIEDLVKAYRHVSAATWDAEYLCLRPSVAGMVYPEFDPQVHAVEKAPEGLKIYRAIDWGFGEFVCLWIGESKDGTMYVLDAYQAQEGTLSDHAKYILAHRIQAVTATYCDPAGSSRNDQTGRSNVQQFNALGIPCRYTTTPRLREVRNGIQMVRGLLRPASGPPRLYYVRSPGAKVFEAAMFGYRNRQVNKIYIDEPQDPQEHEHIPDALRYAVVNRSVPQEVVVVGYGAA